MNYRFIVQASLADTDEIIGIKDDIAEALEQMGFVVEQINVMPAQQEPKWKRAMLNTFLGEENNG